VHHCEADPDPFPVDDLSPQNQAQEAGQGLEGSARALLEPAAAQGGELIALGAGIEDRPVREGDAGGVVEERRSDPGPGDERAPLQGRQESGVDPVVVRDEQRGRHREVLPLLRPRPAGSGDRQEQRPARSA
jgi:hypothetical protein